MSQKIVVKRTDALKAETVHPSGVSVYRTHVGEPEGVIETYNPVELLGVAAGACLLGMVDVAAQTHGFSIEGSTVEVSLEKRENPMMVESLTLNVYMRGTEFSAKEQRIVQAAARICPVVSSLHESIKVTTEFHF